MTLLASIPWCTVLTFQTGDQHPVVESWIAEGALWLRTVECFLVVRRSSCSAHYLQRGTSTKRSKAHWLRKLPIGLEKFLPRLGVIQSQKRELIAVKLGKLISLIEKLSGIK